MDQAHYGVLLFLSTNWALKAERAAKRTGFDIKLIPTPRQLSSDCGTALRFSWEDREALAQALSERGVSFERMEEL